MRNHDNCAAAAELLHNLGDSRLILAVERGGDLVQQQDRGVLNEGARDRNPLPFTAGQFQTAVPNLGVPAVGQLLDHTVEARQSRGPVKLVVGRLGFSHAHVLADGCVKQVNLLEHHRDLTHQRLRVELPHVNRRAAHTRACIAADCDGSAVDIPETRREPQQR